MKRTTSAALGGFIAVAALAFCAAPASAQSTSDSNSGALSGSNSNSNSNANLRNSNRNTNNNMNTSRSNANSNSNSNAGANSNQHQAQGQSVNYNVATDPANQTINNVPNVYAPALAAAGSEVCLGSISAGGAAAGFGVSVGGTLVDQECQLRMNARTLATLGYAVAAREEMCVDPQVRSAMLAAGTPCMADRGPPLSARAEIDAPSQPANVSVVSAASAPPAPGRAPSAPGCRWQYQLLGGWYETCPSTGQAVYASAASPPAEAAAPAAPDPTTSDSGCRRRYQLLGGWYDECK
ncbi:MAG TPA: hypothetical protein VGH40_20070 [Roseiarcus sp.]